MIGDKEVEEGLTSFSSVKGAMLAKKDLLQVKETFKLE